MLWIAFISTALSFASPHAEAALAIAAPIAFQAQATSTEELQMRHEELERRLRETEHSLRQRLDDEGWFEAQDMERWQRELQREMTELQGHIGLVPNDLGRILAEVQRAMGGLIAGIHEGILAHGSDAWDLVERSEQKIRRLEGRLERAQEKAEEAETLLEIREQAKELGAEDEVKPLMDELEKSFEEAQALHEEAKKLHEARRRIARKRELILKRIQLRFLERETARLEQELE